MTLRAKLLVELASFDNLLTVLPALRRHRSGLRLYNSLAG